MDLIDREQLMNYIRSRKINIGKLAHDIIMKQPSIQMQEPKTGHWVKHDTGHSIYYDCSLCSCIAPCTETADKIFWKMANYCPDCGAKMESEGNG